MDARPNLFLPDDRQMNCVLGKGGPQSSGCYRLRQMQRGGTPPRVGDAQRQDGIPVGYPRNIQPGHMVRFKISFLDAQNSPNSENPHKLNTSKTRRAHGLCNCNCNCPPSKPRFFLFLFLQKEFELIIFVYNISSKSLRNNPFPLASGQICVGARST